MILTVCEGSGTRMFLPNDSITMGTSNTSFTASFFALGMGTEWEKGQTKVQEIGYLKQYTCDMLSVVMAACGAVVICENVVHAV